MVETDANACVRMQTDANDANYNYNINYNNYNINNSYNSNNSSKYSYNNSSKINSKNKNSYIYNKTLPGEASCRIVKSHQKSESKLNGITKIYGGGGKELTLGKEQATIIMTLSANVCRKNRKFCKKTAYA